MRFSRVLRNFLLGYAILHLVVAAVFLFVLTAWLRDQMLGQTRHRMLDVSYSLREHIQGLADGMDDPNLLEHLRRLESRTASRFTLIADSGQVVVDSRTGYDEIGNHGDRPEVVDARAGGVGFHLRTSATLDIPLIYLAIPLYDPPADVGKNGFVRIAVEEKTVFETISALQKFLAIFTIGSGLIAGSLMVVFATREMRPLRSFADAARSVASGQYVSIPGIARRHDEWKSLSDAFSMMQAELKQRESSLRENSMRLGAVLSSMIEGVLSMDASSKVLVVNDAACQLLDVPQAELMGRGLFDVVRIPELVKAVRHTFLTQSATETEFETTGNPRRVLEVRVAPLSNQREFGAAIVMHDVTELRNLESMRRDFVANVSHELKTPLASIKAYAETLRLGALHDEQYNRSFLEQIETQAELLDNQIGDLLKLSEIESGHSTFDFTEIDLQQALEDCRDRFRVEAGRRNIEMVIEVADDSHSLVSDPASLQTILDNLVSNAIRYARPSGEVRLASQVTRDAMEIRISDNGIGIADEHRERIFERFYRVDKARSRDVGGTGLGLAIVKHTAVALGGSVHVLSRPGQGSTFVVVLPVRRT